MLERTHITNLFFGDTVYDNLPPYFRVSLCFFKFYVHLLSPKCKTPPSFYITAVRLVKGVSAELDCLRVSAIVDQFPSQQGKQSKKPQNMINLSLYCVMALSFLDCSADNLYDWQHRTF